MPTSAEEQAFLAAIVARYADDGPRLIYADFLDESDEPADRGRAELIRVQCALARLSEDHARRDELQDRRDELLNLFQAVWTDHLRGLAVGFEWRRGLLDSVAVDTATFLAKGDELFRRAPVRRVRLLDAARDVARLAQSPLLASVRELDLCGNELGNGGVNLLLRSRHLTRVEALNLSLNGLCDGGVQLLAKSAALPRLRELSLTDNGQISTDGLRLLADSPHMAGLRALDVSGNDVNEAGVRAVVASRFLTRLQALHVHGNPVGDGGAAELAGSPLLARMLARHPRLSLRAAGVGPAGAHALAASPHLARATALDLSKNHLGDDGARALAASPHLTGLRRLVLRQNHIGDAGAEAVARSGLMARLTVLDFSGNRLTQRGVDALWANRRDFRTRLETAGNFVSDEDVAPRTATAPPHTLHDELSGVLRRLVTAGGADSAG